MGQQIARRMIAQHGARTHWTYDGVNTLCGRGFHAGLLDTDGSIGDEYLCKSCKSAMNRVSAVAHALALDENATWFTVDFEGPTHDEPGLGTMTETVTPNGELQLSIDLVPSALHDRYDSSGRRYRPDHVGVTLTKVGDVWTAGDPKVTGYLVMADGTTYRARRTAERLHEGIPVVLESLLQNRLYALANAEGPVVAPEEGELYRRADGDVIKLLRVFPLDQSIAYVVHSAPDHTYRVGLRGSVSFSVLHTDYVRVEDTPTPEVQRGVVEIHTAGVLHADPKLNALPTFTFDLSGLLVDPERKLPGHLVELDGTDSRVADFVFYTEGAISLFWWMVEGIEEQIVQGKDVSVLVLCRGGRHRSVAFGEALAENFAVVATHHHRTEPVVRIGEDLRPGSYWRPALWSGAAVRVSHVAEGHVYYRPNAGCGPLQMMPVEQFLPQAELVRGV